MPSSEEIAQMGPERTLQMELMGGEIAHWLDRMSIEMRKWKKKIDYWHFEKQLTVILIFLSFPRLVFAELVTNMSKQPLRNLDREWQEEIDSSSMSMLRSLLCFGLCLPKDQRTSIRHGQLRTASAQSTPAMQNMSDSARRQPMRTRDAAYPPRQQIHMQDFEP